jgi:hypothetical protein
VLRQLEGGSSGHHREEGLFGRERCAGRRGQGPGRFLVHCLLSPALALAAPLSLCLSAPVSACARARHHRQSPLLCHCRPAALRRRRRLNVEAIG